MASNVGYSFVGGRDVPTISGISFEVPPGQIVAIVGPSGCGKTTLLRLISGYLRPTEGTIQLDGAEPEASRQTIGFVYQDNRLISWRNVAQNVRLPLEVLKRPLDSALLDELLDLLRLTEHCRKFPSELSGGQQERTALARALVSKPRFLLLDEPLDSTDYVHRLEIEDYIYQNARHNQQCCVLVTHDLEQAAAVADRIVVLGFSSNGQRIEIIEVPENISTMKPSEARVMSETAKFLAQLLARYRTVTSA
ncbi:MAG: ATP-binding cassette domain-containing protein [Candidatus Angelobacter sp.]